MKVATLVDTENLRVEITVPEADVAHVKPGMEVDFRPSGGDRAYKGKIRYVGPSVRRQSRDAIVEAVVQNAGHDLRPGMFVTARLALGEQTLPSVPAKALRAEGNLNHVFVASGGRLEDRLVQTGEARDGQVPIVNGVKAGEQVVAELTAEVHDGARVK
jgi:RND family efflux transporter MFP subunit